MHRQFLGHYEQELDHLNGMAAEFARQFPKIAGRLALDTKDGAVTCKDPYVERLLEGFAFMAARVQLKLDAEFPRFTQNLLNIIYPQYLCPTPSMAMAQFVPLENDASTAQGIVLPRKTNLRGRAGDGSLACDFRTSHEVTLWPLKIVDAQYYTRDLGVLELPEGLRNVRAAIRIRIAATAGLLWKQIPLDELPLFIRANDATRMRIYEQLFADAMGVIVRPAPEAGMSFRGLPSQTVLSPDVISRVGFDERDALLPSDARTFQGYRLIHEYFTFPERFMFANFSSLRPQLAKVTGNEIDLIIPLSKEDVRLERKLDAGTFVPFCSPAVNLFPKRTDRIYITDKRPEHQVVVDKTRPLDFEVHSITRVSGYSENNDQTREFRPFFAANDVDPDSAHGAYYVMNRVPRQFSQREQQRGPRSNLYKGSEAYISVVDAHAAPYPGDVSQLAIEVLATNRDLPISMSVGLGARDFDIDVAAPLQTIRCIGTPTVPRASWVEGEMAWRAISHLSQNYLSLIDLPDGSGAGALRDLLRLYVDESDPSMRQQIDGIKSVYSTPLTRRVPGPGPVTFVRGLEVGVTLDESLYEGSGVFLLGAVLEQVFARYVSINSFTETVVKSTQRGEIKRWPRIVGRRPML
ncbi:MAG: type VI secretion system baseplate subunit TssF [Phycisphaerales bacterium]|nr:type VI secretion system baseplate subunit TssF [Phycisphaerales bacterium]